MYENLDATVRIGKNGISDSTVKEITGQLKKRKVVKVKYLHSSDRNALKQQAAELATKCKAELREIRGFTFVLKR